MPRKGDPGNIGTGAGKRTPEKGNLQLDGVVSPVAIGQLVNTPAAEVDAIDGLEGGAPGLKAHINYPKNAHPAQAISIDRYPPLFMGTNVNDALDELAALIPPMPPVVGTYSRLIPLNGIPDWGELKIAEAPLGDRSFFFVQDTNPDNEIYPYYWYPPHPTQIYPPFEPEGTYGPLQDQGGNDPATDPTFNVSSFVYSGGGPGQTYAGAFTRNSTDYILSARLMEYAAASRPVVVSGTVFPADRGVLALLHWPPDPTIPTFLAQPLEKRCVAAILLGGGILDGLDGLPGGAFTVGTEGSVPGNPYDPFAFPGQATGQFDLEELHTGVYGISFPIPIQGSPLPPPFNASNNALGQVRLGTDPRAGITPLPNGLPILGGTTFARGGGNNQNYFRYRLPYWDDYTQNGLVYTPTMELPRWYKKPSISLNPGTDLTQGGDYPDLPKKYWAFQLARYRHRFLLDNVAGDVIESGDYVLVHFRKEEYFEEFVRDGITPTEDKLYTPQLGSWVNPGQAYNISKYPTRLDGAGPSYHIVRGIVAEDTDALVPPIFSSNSWDYAASTDFVVWTSGVASFLPLQFSGGGAGSPSFVINALSVGMLSMFKNTYRTHDLNTDALHNPNPFFITLPQFSYSTEVSGHITVPATGFVSDPATQVRRQRVEFRFEDLGPYTEFTPPTPASGAAVVLSGLISFEGDVAQPSFSENAKIRCWVRRPVGHRAPNTVNLPQFGLEMLPFNPQKILFHSTRWDGSVGPMYGNFVNGFTGVAEVGLETPLKDTEERFLDEIYRYHSNWINVTPAADRGNLLGPGLAGTLGVPTPIVGMPVRAGSAASPYNFASWAVGQHFFTSLLAVGPYNMNTEAQVAGLPERNPQIQDGVTSPTPSSGLMMYPRKDYTTGYRPSLVLGDITNPQFDYTTAPGSGDRAYVRAFDVDFSRSTPVHAAGQPYFTIRIRGLKLENYAYTNWIPTPGPKGISIYVKVPGVTTWMDLGRPDGDGPSKQDAALDGAGCQVGGVGTFNDVDQETGIVYSQVRVNVGPGQMLFTNTFSEVPVLVKVVVHDNANGRYFDFEQNGSLGACGDVRGLIGVEIVRPEDA